MKTFLSTLAFTAISSAAYATNIKLIIMEWIDDYSNPSPDNVVPEYQNIDVNFFVAARIFNNRDTYLLPALSAVKDCQKNISIIAWCDDMGLGLYGAKQFESFAGEIDGVLGTVLLATSQRASVLSELLGHRPILSHWATSATLNRKDQFPLLARDMIADDLYLQVFAAMVQSLGYTQVACIYLEYDTGPSIKDLLEAALQQRGVGLTAFGHDLNDLSTVYSAMARIKELRLNGIILVTYVGPLISAVAPAAEMYGLNTPDHQYMLTNMDVFIAGSQTVGDVNLTKLLTGAVAVEAELRNSTLFDNYLAHFSEQKDLTPSINAIFPPRGTGDSTTGDCRNYYLPYQINATLFDNAASADQLWARAADAVFAMGLAACKADPGPDPVDGPTMFQTLLNLEFDGLSGPIKFDNKTGNRLTETFSFVVLNWIPPTITTTNDSSSSSNNWLQGTNRVAVGHYDISTGNWTFGATELTFKAGVGLAYRGPQFAPPPMDFNYLTVELQRLGYAEVVIIEVLCMICAAWLIYYRRHRVVVTSQGPILLMTLTGCAIAGMSILGLTVDDDPMQGMNPDVACQLSACAFLLGFVIALVSLLTKTYRIYAIFNSKGLRATGISIESVYIGVTIATVVEIALLLAWSFSYPLHWERAIDTVDELGQTTSWHGACVVDDRGVGWVAFFVLEYAILVILTLVAAQKVRKMPEEFQEAKWLTMAVNALLQTLFLVVPTTVAVYQTAVLARFIVMSSFVVLSILMLLGFLFVPKIHYVYMGGGKGKAIVDMVEGAPTTGGHDSKNNTRNSKELMETPVVGDFQTILNGLKIPTVYRRFEKYCDANYLLESFHFLSDVEEWKINFPHSTEAQKRETARSILKIYIADSSLLQVNVSSALRTATEDAFAMQVRRGTIDITLFDAAEMDICKMLLHGGWATFVADGGLYGVVMGAVQ